VKLSSLSLSLEAGDWKHDAKINYMTPHLWETGATLETALKKRSSRDFKIANHLDPVVRDPESALLVFDSSWIFVRDHVEKLIEWVKSGKTAVVPADGLFTTLATETLNSSLKKKPSIQMTQGLYCELKSLGDGKLILVHGAASCDPLMADMFVDGVANLCEIASFCDSSDARLNILTLQNRGGTLGLFIFNRCDSAIQAKLHFQREVELLGLPLADGNLQERSTQFEISVPAFGIVPLEVPGHASFIEEKRISSQTSEMMKQHLDRAVAVELPGYEDSVWL
jgi:hypothetical protein